MDHVHGEACALMSGMFFLDYIGQNHGMPTVKNYFCDHLSGLLTAGLLTKTAMDILPQNLAAMIVMTMTQLLILAQVIL